MKDKNLAATISATLCLVAICFVVTLCVAGTRYAFAEKIAEQEWAEKQTVMSRLISAESYEEISLPNQQTAFVAKDGETIVGYIFETAAYGYGSDVSVMTAIHEGKILGVEVLDASNETPGLGQNVTNENFTEQFKNLITEPQTTKTATGAEGEIVAVTGATKTSNAVVASVKEALSLFNEISEG